jgi:hypothetical protein
MDRVVTEKRLSVFKATLRGEAARSAASFLFRNAPDQVAKFLLTHHPLVHRHLFLRINDSVPP